MKFPATQKVNDLFGWAVSYHQQIIQIFCVKDREPEPKNLTSKSDFL